MAQSINITELNLPQLEMLKNQLDQVVTGPIGTSFPLYIPPAHAYFLAPGPKLGAYLAQAKPLSGPRTRPLPGRSPFSP